jgi:hypothetical protein
LTSDRKTALIAGVLFLVTFVTSIPAILLYDPVLNNTRYVLSAGSDTRVYFGAFLEVLLAIANIGTAVVLFPILKRQREGVALGYVASRILESTLIVVGIVSVLSLVTLRQDLAGRVPNHGSLVIAGRSLVAFHDWTFLLGPSFCAGIGTGLLLGYLMYTSGLVPRGLAMLGLVAGALCFVAATGVLFDIYDAGSPAQGVLTAPEFIWELSLGIYLTVKGFKPSPILEVEKHRPLQPS